MPKSAERVATTGTPPYVIISLGTFGGWSSVALGINQLGQVVGGADTPEGGRHAFLWSSGIMRDLGTPLGLAVSEATDLNDTAQVTGVAFGSTRSRMHAFFWEDGQEMLDLGHLGGGDAEALGINNAGTVVGYSTALTGYSQAFLWAGGDLLPIPSGFGGLRSRAFDINDIGQIVGAATTTSEEARAFLWQDGVMQNLGTLGGDISSAFGVNEHAVVVGDSERAPGGDRVSHAFLWKAGQMTDLSALGGFLRSVAWAINKDGQVVGEASQEGPRFGFFYDPDSQIADADSLVSADSGWCDLLPRDINDAGQIVGAGTFLGRRLAFLMTPLDTDFDDDDRTGLEDYAAFRDCLTGPGVPVGDGCQSCDVNRDGAVDLRDVQPFQWTFGSS